MDNKIKVSVLIMLMVLSYLYFFKFHEYEAMKEINRTIVKQGLHRNDILRQTKLKKDRNRDVYYSEIIFKDDVNTVYTYFYSHSRKAVPFQISITSFNSKNKSPKHSSIYDIKKSLLNNDILS